MIYITGDTHIPINLEKLTDEKFPEQEQFTKSDYIIITGDFGGIWDGSDEEKFWIRWLNERNFTTLFVDGNHENFEIDGIKIFTMGGATSIDKIYRVEGKSWWAEEMPSESEYQNAIENLTKHDYKVDYIITHCCPDSIQNKINPYYSHDKLTNFLEAFVKEKCNYKHWFFVHYHEDLEIDSKHTCLYHRIIKIK